jgi:putative transposase
MDNKGLAVPQYGCSVADLYHCERNHQGLDNRLIQPEPTHLVNTGTVQRRERLGGMLNYYHRVAA